MGEIVPKLPDSTGHGGFTMPERSPTIQGKFNLSFPADKARLFWVLLAPEFHFRASPFPVFPVEKGCAARRFGSV
jgi:hypothetical protein